MKIEAGKFCPLLGKDCIGLECNWMTQVRGKHPQTGADVDEWGCAIKWMPILLINAAHETRHTTAATESLRNEVVQVTRDAMSVQVAIANQQHARATGDTASIREIPAYLHQLEN